MAIRYRLDACLLHDACNIYSRYAWGMAIQPRLMSVNRF